MNVICILYDSLRQDCVRSSAAFKKLKEKSLYIPDVMTASTWTKTSVSSIFSATYPGEHGVYYEKSKFPDYETWVHKLRFALGIHTTCISSNPWVMEKFGFDKMFNDFKYVKWDPHSPQIGTEKCCDTKIYGMLRDKFSKPIMNNFVYAHMMRTHQPYHGHSYWNGVEACGQQVLDFIDFIDNGPNAETTVIMVVSDHGESLGENGFNFHSDSVQHVEAKVPMFFYSKGSEKSMGTEMENFEASNIDIGPTILDIFGLPEHSLDEFIPGISIFDPPVGGRIRICESQGRGQPGRGRKTAIMQGNTKAVFHGDKLNYVCDPYTEGRKEPSENTKKVAEIMLLGYKGDSLGPLELAESVSQDDLDGIKIENSMKELGYL